MRTDPLINNDTKRSPCLTCVFKDLDKNKCASTCSKLAAYRTGMGIEETEDRVGVEMEEIEVKMEKRIEKRIDAHTPDLKGKKKKEKEKKIVLCAAEGCKHPSYSRGLCRSHYDAWRFGSFYHPAYGRFSSKHHPETRTPEERNRRSWMAKINLIKYPKVVSALWEMAELSMYPIDHIVVSLLTEGLISCCKDGSYDFSRFGEKGAKNEGE